MEPINTKELEFSILTEADIATLHRLKDVLVKSQMYQEAAILRDLEKRMITIIEEAKKLGYPTSRKLEKARIDLNDQYYSHAELMSIVELTTKPLKDALTRYEDSMKTLIDHNLRVLITENHKLKIRSKEDHVEFAEFILLNYAPYNFIFQGSPRTAYRKQSDGNSWDGEPSRVYTTEEVYNDFLDYQKKQQHIKGGEVFWKQHPGVRSVFVSGENIPLELVCEHEGCAEKHGRDYKRPKTGGSLDNEPLFLCDEHGRGYEPFTT